MFITILIGIFALVAVGGVLSAVAFKRAENAHEPQEITKRDAYGNRRTAMSSYDGPPAYVGGIVAGVSGLLAVIILLFSTIVTVQTPNVGIELAFGKPVGHVPSGLSLKAPWDSVVTLDGSVQTWSFTGKNCITVRIANSQTACADVSVQGQTNPNGVDNLYRKFNGNGTSIQDNISGNLVFRRTEVDMNQSFANFNPVSSITSKYPVGSPQNPSATSLTAKVQQTLQNDIGQYVTIRDVLMPRITYDTQVQTALNTVLQQKAKTEVALQAEQTALAQAQANKDLQSSLTNNPLVLVSRCEDIVQEAIQVKYQLPQGFGNCVSNSSAVIAALGGK